MFSSIEKFFNSLTTSRAIKIIIIVGIIVFFNSLFNGFVWDDISQIVENPGVHSLSNIPSFFFGTQDIFGNIIKIHAVYYRPLMASLFIIIYSFFGSNAFFFHLLSIVIHITITILVFIFFRRFFKQFIAFFLALIFLIHPLNTEVVNYISAYNDLLYLLFGLIALILVQTNINWFKKILLISIAVFLSLLSKESGFLFIPIILVYVFLYRENKERYSISLALGLVIFAYWLLRTSFYVDKPLNQVLGFSPFLHMFIAGHLINIPKIFYYYIGNFFFPIHQAIAQHWVVQNITFADFYFPLIVLAGFIIFNSYLFFYSCQSKDVLKNFIFFSIWFWFGMFFYFQLFPLDMTVADRWFYFPIIGLLGLIGIFSNRLTHKKIIKNIIISLISVYIVLIATKTIIRNTDWFNEYTLYTHDLKIESQSFDLENQLGIVYSKQGKPEEAKLHFEKSIRLWQCSQAQNNLGYLNQQEGNIAIAEKHYIKAVSCDGEYKSYGNLILLLFKENKLDLADRYAKEGIKNYPNSAALYYLLGLTEYKRGDRENALKNLNISYQLSHDPQIMNTLIQMQNKQ